MNTKLDGSTVPWSGGGGGCFIFHHARTKLAVPSLRKFIVCRILSSNVLSWTINGDTGSLKSFPVVQTITIWPTKENCSRMLRSKARVFSSSDMIYPADASSFCLVFSPIGVLYNRLLFVHPNLVELTELSFN